MIHAVISSQLDYCHELFTGLPRSQSINSNLFRTLRKDFKENQANILHLSSLHCTGSLFLLELILKVSLLAYKALNCLAPSYIQDCIYFYVPARYLGLYTTGLINLPVVSHKNNGERAFCYYAPVQQNTPLQQIRTVFGHFKKQMKMYLFK